MDLKSKEPKGFVCLGGQKVSLNQKKRTKLSENKDFWRSPLHHPINSEAALNTDPDGSNLNAIANNQGYC